MEIFVFKVFKDVSEAREVSSEETVEGPFLNDLDWGTPRLLISDPKKTRSVFGLEHRGPFKGKTRHEAIRP